MADFIDRAAVLDVLEEKWEWRAAAKIVRHHSFAKPKEVVQCKNCGWHDEDGEDFCRNFNVCVKDNDYCSLWVKKRRRGCTLKQIQS